MSRQTVMQGLASQGNARPGWPVPKSPAAAAWQLPIVSAAIATAWLFAVGMQLTGNAALLHHHALIEGDTPIWVAVPLFLLGWQAMIGAMMLPASLPSIDVFHAGAALLGRRRGALVAFVASYALVWSAFGLLAFLGDDILHHVVDATPWLAARPWLIEASVIALAGAYQFSPLKRRSLMACRHPAALAPRLAVRNRGSFELGLDHALACIGSSWALMLLMFAEGFANLGWMVALTAVMVYEATGRRGQRAAAAVGAGLLVLGSTVVLSGAH